LGDLFEVVERPVALRDDQTYQLVNARRSRAGVAPRERLAGSQIRVRNQFLLEAGDFLISKRQIIHGACGIVPPELAGAVVSNEYAVLKPKPPLSSEYLRYLPELPYFQRTCFHSSVGVDVEKMVFKLDQWFTFHVPLPPPEEQRRIARSLFAADEAIQKTEAVIDQLEVVKRSLLANLIGPCVVTSGTRMSKTKAWHDAAIGELGRVEAGRQRNPTALGTPRPYLRVANVHDGEIRTDDVLQMPFTDAEFERFRLQPGDILLNEGQSLELVGRCAIYEGSPSPCAFQNSLIRFRAGPYISTHFAFHLFRLLSYEGVFSSVATQTTSIAHLGVSRFAAIRVRVPPLSQQDRLSERLSAIDEVHRATKKGLDAVHHQRAALLDALLTGRVRVNFPSQEAA